MHIKNKIILFGAMILFTEFIIFRANLSPIHWGYVKAKTIATTGPDVYTIGSKWYLKYITPDSLKKYNLDYSGLMLTEYALFEKDFYGDKYYKVKGKIVGKMIADGSSFFPLFKIESKTDINIFFDIFIKIAFVCQIIYWLKLIHQFNTIK